MLAKNQGGKIVAGEKALSIKGADCVTLYLAAATDYNRANPGMPLETDRAKRCTRTLEAAAGKSFAKLYSKHIAEHQRLFNRVTIDLGSSDAGGKPTDERLRAVKGGGVDPELVSLYFQYGRYLLICSSRPGCMKTGIRI